MSNVKRLKITEIFFSLQGEALTVGMRSEAMGLFMGPLDQCPVVAASRGNRSSASGGGQASAEEVVRERGDQEETQHGRGEVLGSEPSELEPAPPEDQG